MASWDSKKTIEADAFARLVSGIENRDERYAFFLGAGCSITSGIPAAAGLVRDLWLPKLVQRETGINPIEIDESSVEEWVKSRFNVTLSENPASLYGKVMELLYPQERKRQGAIQEICEGKSPGFGYATLAQFMVSKGDKFNVVLTTNFDDLVTDALFLFTGTKPLVITHESLAEFIRPNPMGPVIIKLHGDAHLFPKNLKAEIERVIGKVTRQIEVLLQMRGLIFIGYGGNDEGIVSMLKGLPADAIPYGIYWVSRDEPQNLMRRWLDEREAIWVRSPGFDELLLLIQSEGRMGLPDRTRIDKMYERYRFHFQQIMADLESRPSGLERTQMLLNAAKKIDALFPADWGTEVVGSRLPMAAPIVAPKEPADDASLVALNLKVAEVLREVRFLSSSLLSNKYSNAADSVESEASGEVVVTTGAMHASRSAVDRGNSVQSIAPDPSPQRGSQGRSDAMILIAAGPFKKGLTGHQVDLIISQFVEQNLAIDLDFARESLLSEPTETANLPAFLIDDTPVTNQEFSQFVSATNYKTESEKLGDSQNWTIHISRRDHPVVFVSHRDAMAYSKWAGKRLPTSDEWQKACRGQNGNIYPWGDRFDAHKCNTAESQRGFETTPVRKFVNGRSPYGCYDMVGNVEEWTGTKDNGGGFVVLGGSWEMSCQVYGLAVLRRLAPPEFYSRDLGFRCVKDV